MAEPITLRAVDRFAEPVFSELVNELLHDPERHAVAECLFRSPAVPPVQTLTQQVRIGAFAGDALVGWSHGFLTHGAALYVSNSAVAPPYRRQGIYTRLVAAMEQEALALGCLRVESHHRAANSTVLIAKLKAGYVIVGTEFTAEMGLLVKMSKQLEPSRHEVFEARSGILEGTVRFFGGAGKA